MKKEKTKYTGVWAQLSSTKKHRGKPDKCYYIVFRKNSKVVWEKIGWEGDGYTAKAASNVRSDRLSSLRNGKKLPQDKKVIPLFKDVVEKYLEWCKTNKIIRA